MLLLVEKTKPTCNPRDSILRCKPTESQLQPTYVDICLCSATERRQSIVKLLVPWWNVGAQVYGCGRNMC
jgi:hypothetical protein